MFQSLKKLILIRKFKIFLVAKCIIHKIWDRQKDKKNSAGKRHITKYNTTNPPPKQKKKQKLPRISHLLRHLGHETRWAYSANLEHHTRQKIATVQYDWQTYRAAQSNQFFGEMLELRLAKQKLLLQQLVELHQFAVHFSHLRVYRPTVIEVQLVITTGTVCNCSTDKLHCIFPTNKSERESLFCH